MMTVYACLACGRVHDTEIEKGNLRCGCGMTIVTENWVTKVVK